MPSLNPYRASPDTWVLPSYLTVPGIGLIVVNSYLIESEEPVVIDTGMPVVRQEFLENLWSLINPQDVRWVILTHDDADHAGNLLEVLGAATNATLVTQFIGYARLTAGSAGKSLMGTMPNGGLELRLYCDTCSD